MKKGNLTLKIIALIALTDLLEAAYEFLFKKGMLVVGEFDFVNMGMAGFFLLRLMSCGWIWVGLAVIIIETFLWFAVLSRIDLSIAFPVSSMSYIYVLVISSLLLGEHVSPNRWIGTFIILAGILIIAKSSRKKAARLEKI